MKLFENIVTHLNLGTCILNLFSILIHHNKVQIAGACMQES